MEIYKEIQHVHHHKTTTTNNNTTKTLAPGGGLSNLLLLKIIGFLDDIQDIACLLMTCKAYYIAFRIKYANVITFKYVKRYGIIEQSMKTFQEIFDASYEQRDRFILDRVIDLEDNKDEMETSDSPIEMKDEPILINATVNQNNITRIPPTRKLTITGYNIVDCNAILSKLSHPRILESLEISNQHVNIDPLQVPSLKALYIHLQSQHCHIQFPLMLVELHLSYLHYERFSLDLLTLEQLTKLNIVSKSPYIHAKDIKIPKTSLKHLSIQFILYDEFEDFFPDTLESLDLQDISLLGDALPPPNLKSMSIGNCEKVPPANFFPSSLKSLKLIFSSEKSFIAGLLPLGLETLELNNYNGPVTLEYIPDTVTTLTINNIGHPMNTVLPSGLQNLTFRPESEPPTMYPSTIRSINYQKRYQHTPTLFILPTSIESFSFDAVEAKTTYQNTVFSLPQIMIINNDDSPLADNPFHFVLPSRVAHLTAGVQVDNDSKFSFRLDTIINYSNVQDLSIIINSKREMKFKIRRLEPNNEYFMLHSKDSFDGAIVRQKRLSNNSMVNRSILEYYPLFEEWMDFSFTHASAALETPLETNCRSYRTPKSCEEHSPKCRWYQKKRLCVKGSGEAIEPEVVIFEQ
ncbi:hypothetical protein DFA_09296 [Cavenderia fasciculata]|uniref:Uncharacterized protein n=1 Tax=Cavenderia fasciculata TaxID=261658 RepID=F4Q784_CACFS|nr:uncharacterized protein DFA_09296 [Cavenderia fasciculata]EGG16266.1 hypothetical protein DFA_09296 [Cavenderia fasciculata]|eukprot:XP_004354650.1 hypothetical protein DFA_09296 [Cavenderia fasciculata]